MKTRVRSHVRKGRMVRAHYRVVSTAYYNGARYLVRLGEREEFTKHEAQRVANANQSVATFMSVEGPTKFKREGFDHYLRDARWPRGRR